MKHNEYIIRGYRINFDSATKVLKRYDYLYTISLFMVHNESVNVWSHLLGSAIVIILVIYTAIYIHNHQEMITDFDFSKVEAEISELTAPIFPKYSIISKIFI